MAKKPNNTPQVGDQVRLKGRAAQGTLKRIDDRLWAFVEWKSYGPTVCHLYELEKLCDHKWMDESILYKDNFRMTATICNRCGVTYNSWSQERDRKSQN